MEAENSYVDLMLDNVQFLSKPCDCSDIVNRLSKSMTHISIPKLADALAHGYTIRPAVCGNKKTDWVQQQVFCIDFDNDVKFQNNVTGKNVPWDKSITSEEQVTRDNCHVIEDCRTTIEEQLGLCEQYNLYPAFGYYSFSSTNEFPRWRLVFICNNVITKYQIAEEIQFKLYDLFPKSDRRCTNLNRHYYGGTELIPLNFYNVFSVQQLGISDEFFVQEKCDTNNNIYNIIGGTKRCNSNIEAIQCHDIQYLRDNIGNKHTIFENRQQFYSYIFSYDLATLLEIDSPKLFCCIFPDHKDHKPSAGIMQHKDGHYQYRCFAENVNYNIINVIERLGKFKSRPKTIRFIMEIFNIEIQKTEWQKQQEEILEENQRMLFNGEFELNCPTAYKHIKRYLPTIIEKLYIIAKDNVKSEKLVDDDNNVVFYSTTRFLCKELGIEESNHKSIIRQIVFLTYHLLLNKLSDNQIPPKMLKHSQQLQIKNGYKKHPNYFSIPSYTTEIFLEIEKQAIKWDKYNYSMRGCSREMFFRAEGKEVADWLYPQYSQYYNFDEKVYKDRKTSPKSDERQKILSDLIVNKINAKGYCLERDKEILAIIVDSDICSKTSAETQLKKSLYEVVENNNLIRTRATKEIKKKYNITNSGAPIIFIRDNH